MTVNLAQYIDHTQLKADTSEKMINQMIKEAKEYQFATVCVNPYWVAYCSKELKDTLVKVCTVVGFPLGSATTDTKVFETKQAIDHGATEIDMVLNIGELKSGNDDLVKQDIAAVVAATKEKALVKVIIETSLLTDNEKVRASLLIKQANADYVKTSTGFSDGGATIEDIKLIRKNIGTELGIKASGGIRDLKSMKNMIVAGATRIGASASIDIINEK